MKISQKRKVGEMLQRSGIASRIIALADNISEGTFKNALERAGQISVLVEAATHDEYWCEKTRIGVNREQEIFAELLEDTISLDRVKHLVNPYLQTT